jgi:hypothetical protein
MHAAKRSEKEPAIQYQSCDDARREAE